MSINSCGINGLASGRRVEGLGNGGSVNFVVLVAVVCALADFAVVVFGFAFAGFAFACAIGFVLWAVAFFVVAGFALVVGFLVVVAFFATGFVFAMIYSLCRFSGGLLLAIYNRLKPKIGD